MIAAHESAQDFARLVSLEQNYPQRVQVPDNLVLGFRVRVIIVQFLGKSLIIRHVDL